MRSDLHQVFAWKPKQNMDFDGEQDASFMGSKMAMAKQWKIWPEALI